MTPMATNFVAQYIVNTTKTQLDEFTSKLKSDSLMLATGASAGIGTFLFCSCVVIPFLCQNVSRLICKFCIWVACCCGLCLKKRAPNRHNKVESAVSVMDDDEYAY